MIVLATNNENKRKEIASILPAVRFLDIETPEIEETGETYKANAILKASETAKLLKTKAVAEDSGFEVQAMGWGPGIYSHRWAPDPREGIERILNRLKGVALSDRTARYVACIAVSDPGGEVVWTYQAELRGIIANQLKGQYGFAYDPIFIPNGENRTLAEIPPEERVEISHRALVFKEAYKLGYLN